MAEAPKATSLTRPKNAVSVRVMRVCAKLPNMIG